MDIDSLADKAKIAFGKAADTVATKAQEAATSIEARATEAATDALSKRLSHVVNELLAVLNKETKKAATADPYMPTAVASAIRDLVDAGWPTVHSEIHDAIFSAALRSNPDLPHGQPPAMVCGCRKGGEDIDPENGCCCTCCGGAADGACACCCDPCFGVVAFVRYHSQPYDQSVWQKLRDPWWWLLLLVSVVPKYGISIIFYTIYLAFFLDKSDEFQLLRFVGGFKTALFISYGLLSACVGFGQLYVCVVSSMCPEFSPKEELWTLFLLVAQNVLCWVAYCALMREGIQQKGGLAYKLDMKNRPSVAEGGPKETRKRLLAAMTEDAVETAYLATAKDSGSKGRLRKLLIYDTIVFFVCVGVGLWGFFGNTLASSSSSSYSSSGNSTTTTSTTNPFSEDYSWRAQLTFYMAKTMYGFLSIPWLLIVIPGLSSLFTTAKPTGYNRYGNTVPLLAAPDKGKIPWRAPTPGCCAPDLDEDGERKAAESSGAAVVNNNNNNNNNNADSLNVPLMPAMPQDVVVAASTDDGQPQWGNIDKTA